MLYSKNLLFLFFAHWFLWAVMFNNLFEYQLSFLVLGALWVLFFVYFLWKKKLLYYWFVILLGIILWIYISQVNMYKIDQKNNFILQNNSQYNYYNLEIKQLTKKQQNDNFYSAKIISRQDQNISENILIEIKIANMYQIQSWDIIQTEIKLNAFQNTKEFSYKNYMNSKNIYASAYINNFEKIWSNKPHYLQSQAQSIREYLLAIVYKIYPKNEAIFLGWILLWARESLSDEIKQDFNNSWLTHFIAVSWFNITILIIFFWFLVKYFPKIIQLLLMSFFLIFFVLIVWDTAPVIRAAIMWILGYIILLSWRNTHSYTLVCLTGLIMVWISPYTLNYDVSFALSFLAVLWIIFTQNFWKKIFFFMPEFLAIKEALVLTFSAMVFTLPIMIFNFGQVSIMSPFANIAVTWTIPIAMLTGFISILFYFITPTAGIIAWYFAWVLLKYDMLMVDYFWNLDFSVYKLDFWIYKTQFFILYFLVMIFLVLYFQSNSKQKKEQTH